jgi:hypothetical protein
MRVTKADKKEMHIILLLIIIFACHASRKKKGKKKKSYFDEQAGFDEFDDFDRDMLKKEIDQWEKWRKKNS